MTPIGESPALSHRLSLPVGAMLRPAEALFVEDSLQRAAEELRQTGLAFIPVAHGPTLVGAIDSRSIAKALAGGLEPSSAIGHALAPLPPSIRPYATGAEALRQLELTGLEALMVADDDGRLLGLISGSDLIARDRTPLRPRVVGGMATPQGVFLTNGSITAGVGSVALVLTGVLLFSLFLTANVLVGYAGPVLSQLNLSQGMFDGLLNGLTLALFLFGLRALPLAGIHAAEHMVVHAIERGEDLVPEVVRRMPRVHPRCGTNVAAGAMLFVGVVSQEWLGDLELRVLLGGLVTLFLWRPIGSALQYFVTTKPPSLKQIESGIRAGKELLHKYQNVHHSSPSVGMRLWNSGLPQIMLGSSVVAFSLELINRFTGWLDWLVPYLG